MSEVSDKLFAFLSDIPMAFGSALITHFMMEKDEGGKKTRTLNSDVVRQEAPYFHKTLADEAEFCRLTTQMTAPLQKALLEHWISTLGKNQKDDFIISIHEMSAGGKENEKLALEKLNQLARIPDNARRSVYAVSQKMMKASEDDYLVVKLETFAKSKGKKAWTELRKQLQGLPGKVKGACAQINDTPTLQRAEGRALAGRTAMRQRLRAL